MWSKRNILCLVGIMALYLGTMLFGAYRKEAAKTEQETETVSPSPARPAEIPPALEAVSGPEVSSGSPIASGRGNKKGKEAERETREWEELYPDHMDVSDIPEEILELLHATAEEMSERVRIFANGQGMAGMEEVYCYGADAVEQEGERISVPLYFSAEGKDGEEESRYRFEYVFYRETGEYCMRIG